MDPRFLHHNSHLINPDEFADRDPQLRYLNSQPYVFHSKLIEEFPLMPGIYTLAGGRQIGKTTLLKQWMFYLLKKQIPANALAFLSGELIQDHFMLMHLLQRQLESMPQKGMKFLILDEVNYIQDWDKAIKYAADAGLLDEVMLFLTGSDSVFIKEARMRFPGRRGKSEVVDFHYYPLSFREFIFLKHRVASDEEITIELLFSEFNSYLIHGGFLTAINDIAEHGFISSSTLVTYSDWIRGDMIKRGKQEHYLREIVFGILKRYGSQVTWNSLSKDQAIDHPQTIYDYVNLLEEMDAVFVQKALMENELTGAPKKARKIYFADPFIYHALQAWIYPQIDPYKNQILAQMANSQIISNWAEGCAVTHYRRFYPTFYIKGEEAEVDIAYIHQDKFWPIEIKWTNQIHSKDYKQLAKYRNGIILTKRKETSSIGLLPTIPLPLALFHLAV